MVNLGNFFGQRGKKVDPSSDRQRSMACKAQGLVFDKDTKRCRASRRGAGLAAARTARAMNRALAGPTQKDIMAACKAQGLVLDKATKQCRPSKRGLSGLERAYARGSVFFGVDAPAAAQRSGIVYANPVLRRAWSVTGQPVKGTPKGPADFLLYGGMAPQSMQDTLGVKIMSRKADPANIPGVPTPKGNNRRGNARVR